jgi:hypothetical protein
MTLGGHNYRRLRIQLAKARADTECPCTRATKATVHDACGCAGCLRGDWLPAWLSRQQDAADNRRKQWDGQLAYASAKHHGGDGPSCNVSADATWNTLPGSTRLQLPPAGGYAIGPIEPSLDIRPIVDIDLPGPYTHAVLKGYSRGLWDTTDFIPRLPDALGGALSFGGEATAVELGVPFRDYIDYCSYAAEVLEEFDAMVPLWLSCPMWNDFGREVLEDLEGTGSADWPPPRSNRPDRELIGPAEAWNRAWGYLRRRRGMIRRTDCCKRDYAGALRSGEGFTLAGWMDEAEDYSFVAPDRLFGPVNPALASSKGRRIRALMDWVSATAQAASYWLQAAVTIHCFQRTWHRVLTEKQNAVLQAQSAGALRAATGWIASMASVALHELVHAVGPNPLFFEHEKQGCCQAKIAFKWECRNAHKMGVPLVFARGEISYLSLFGNPHVHLQALGQTVHLPRQQCGVLAVEAMPTALWEDATYTNPTITICLATDPVCAGLSPAELQAASSRWRSGC